MKRVLPILHLTGFTMVIFSLTMLVPIGVAAVTHDGTLMAFVDSFVIGLLLGGIPFAVTRRQQRELQARDGFLLVSLAWTLLPLIAAIPLLIHFSRAGIPISFTAAYFEAMSALTTTGATVLSNLDALPPAIHVWRAILVWVGGLGILVLAVAILPLLGVGGSQVVRAETPGPMKDDKLTPRIAGTAKALYAIYVGMSALCWLAYLAVGLSGVDAFVHMCATVALGGFSTLDANIGGFNSLAVEMVAIVFMLVSAINFATHYRVWRSRSLAAYRTCPETRYFLAIVLGCGLLVSVYLYASGIYSHVGDALRYGMFNAVSMATTTGFANTDFAAWPPAVTLLMLVVSCFAASSASTGGGIKLIRMLLVVRQAGFELLRLVHPRAVAPLRLGGRIVDPRVLQGVMGFLVLYAATLLVATLLLLASGLDGTTAVTAALASLNNTGTGLGLVGPAGSFANLTDFQIWVCIVTMLLGRLELATVLVLFTPMFWRR